MLMHYGVEMENIIDLKCVNEQVDHVVKMKYVQVHVHVYQMMKVEYVESCILLNIIHQGMMKND